MRKYNEIQMELEKLLDSPGEPARKINRISEMLDCGEISMNTPYSMASAAKNGLTKIGEIFIEHGQRMDNYFLDPFLCIAAHHGQNKFCEMLLRKGVDVNVSDRKGWTALHQAADQGNLKLCKLLLKQENIDVNCQNRMHYTPLLLALAHNHIALCHLLLETGAKTDVGYKEGVNFAIFSKAEILVQQMGKKGWVLSGGALLPPNYKIQAKIAQPITSAENQSHPSKPRTSIILTEIEKLKATRENLKGFERGDELERNSVGGGR